MGINPLTSSLFKYLDGSLLFLLSYSKYDNNHLSD